MHKIRVAKSTEDQVDARSGKSHLSDMQRIRISKNTTSEPIDGHPEGNGLAERNIKTSKLTVSQGDEASWDQVLQEYITRKRKNKKISCRMG